MASTFYFNQQQRGIPGQIGINPLQGQQYLQQQQVQQQVQQQAQQAQQQQQQQQALRQQAIDSQRKRAHSKAVRQNAPAAEEPEEPVGDELDDISARDIAMARYKRNHDYLSEIFTPFNASSIIPAPLEFSQTKEELNKQIEEYKENIKKQKREQNDRLIEFEKENETFWKLMQQLTEAEDLTTIETTSANIANELKVQIQYRPQKVSMLSIPNIETHTVKAKTPEDIQEEHFEPEKEEEDNMDLYFNDKEEEEGNDSFFNDMVNTEDDPTVNEFLNTE